MSKSQAVIPTKIVIQDNGLPDGWELKPIGELVQSTRPRILPSEKPDLPFLGMDHIEANTMRMLGSVLAGSMKSSAVHFQPGDILYGRLRPYLNKVFQPHFEGLCSAEFIVFPESDEMDNSYLQYFLNSLQFVRHATSLNSGDRPRVKFEQLAPYCIPLPPSVEQQKRIVAKIEELFSHIDTGIEALKKAKQLLKQYRQSVLKAAVTGELTKEWREANKDKLEPASQLLERILIERRQKWEQQQLEQFKAKGKMPKDDKWKEKYREPYDEYEEVSKLPKEWCWSAVDQLGEVQLGRQRSPKNRSSDHPTKYIRAANITEEGLDLTDLMDMEFKPNEFERYVMQEDDLVLSEASGSPDRVGKPAIWRENMPACCFQNTVIRHRPYGVEPEYLLAHYKYFYWCRIFSKTAGGVGINHLSAQKFLKLSIALPPLLEQKEIVRRVYQNIDALTRLDAEIQMQLVKAEKNKQSILASAFSGELR